MIGRGGEDPALADELASIRALGEGRRGDAVEPDARDADHADRSVEDVEKELGGGSALDD